MKTYGTRYFLVFQIDLDACKATPTSDLGDTAFFLGANASLSVQASQFPGIKPNHIYFTDICLDGYIKSKEGGGLDMGMFNLAVVVYSHIILVFPSVMFVHQFGLHQLCVEHPSIHRSQLRLLMFIRFLRILPKSACT